MSKKKRIKKLERPCLTWLEKEKEGCLLPAVQKKASSKQVEEEAAPPPDEEIFMAAMQGVKQMDSPGGRQVTPQTAPKTTATPLEDDAENDLKRFMRGDVEFELEYTDEFMYGYVRGLDIKTFQQLKAGISVLLHTSTSTE